MLNGEALYILTHRKGTSIGHIPTLKSAHNMLRSIGIKNEEHKIEQLTNSFLQNKIWNPDPLDIKFEQSFNHKNLPFITKPQ